MTARSPCARLLVALAAATASLAAGCGDSAGPADDDASDASGDAVDLTGRSLYRVVLTPRDLDPITLERELTDREATHFAFGSTHIAPAVSLAMSDSVTAPRTIFFALNFGIVVASDTYPLATDGLGLYPFDATPPEVELTLSGLEYRSTVAGASGDFDITAWSVTPGEVVSGTFSGRLIQDTTLEDKRWVDVEGSFHFTLPPRESGQPN